VIQIINLKNSRFNRFHFVEYTQHLSEGASPFCQIDWNSTRGTLLTEHLDVFFE
jgi:hypothetical protein